MSLLRPDVAFPYCDIYTVYIRCGQSELLKCIFKKMITLLYPECIDVIYPITSETINNQHFTYAVHVMDARSFYDNFHPAEVYPWHVNAISVQVPYGNRDEWMACGRNWLTMVGRTVRAMWHGFRVIPNDLQTQRKYINVSIPWIPLDKKIDECTDQELYEYAEHVLAICSTQIWVMDRQVITPHVHST